jgi:hypothetical protein
MIMAVIAQNTGMRGLRYLKKGVGDIIVSIAMVYTINRDNSSRFSRKNISSGTTALILLCFR